MGHHQRLRRLGLNSDALLCLTPEFAQHFNETTPNHPQVHYYSYAGPCFHALEASGVSECWS